MDTGVAIFPTHNAIAPADVARLAEERGYESLFVAVTAALTVDRVLASGDAWFPNHAPEGILDRARELRARSDRPVGLMVMGVPADPKSPNCTVSKG